MACALRQQKWVVAATGSFDSPIAAGSLVVVISMWGDSTAASCSNGVDTFVEDIVRIGPFNSIRLAIHHAYNVSSGSPTFTLPSGDSIRFLLLEYTGVKTSSDPVDAVTGKKVDGTSSPTTDAFAIAANTAVAICALADFNAVFTSTAVSPFTMVDTGNFRAIEDAQNPSANASATGSFTLSDVTSANAQIAAVTFLLPDAASGNPYNCYAQQGA